MSSINSGDIARRIATIRARRAQEAEEIRAALANLRFVATPANDDAPAAPVMEVVTSAASAADPIQPVAAPAPVPDLVTKAPARPRRKKRRSGLAAKADARRMRAHGRAPGSRSRRTPTATPSTSSTSPTPSSTSPTISTTTTKTSTTTTPKTARPRLIKSWDDAGEHPRIMACNRGLDRFGVPMAFSVNFDPKLIQAGNDNKRGLLDYLRRRVALALKRALGETPPMWIVIETEDDGRPHIHGGMALTDRHPSPVVLGALSAAGGHWTTQGSATAHLRDMPDPDGWALYPLKRCERTRHDLRALAGLPAGARVPLYAVSADLLTEGKRRHEEARRAVGRE